VQASGIPAGDRISLLAWAVNSNACMLGPAVLFSQNKPATNNQPAVLFSQNKPAPAISHQPNEQAASLFCLQYEALAKSTVTGTTLFLAILLLEWQRGHPKGGNQIVGTLNYTTVGVLDILVLKFFSPTSCVIAKVQSSANSFRRKPRCDNTDPTLNRVLKQMLIRHRVQTDRSRVDPTQTQLSGYWKR
jgi:hypothetical protein